MRTYLAVYCLALVCAAASPENERAAALKTLQDSYRRPGMLSLHFSQQYHDSLRGKSTPESGTIWVTADGRLRWSYREPLPKDFVFDGKKAFFYEPAHAQATVFDEFADSPLHTAISLFFGRGDVYQAFVPAPCDESCGFASSPGMVAMLLRPKESIPTVQAVALWIDLRTGRLTSAQLFDHLGNRTTYLFSDFVTTAEVDAKKFTFVVPAGVSVLPAR